MKHTLPLLACLIGLCLFNPSKLVSAEWMLQEGNSFDAELYMLVGRAAYFEMPSSSFACLDLMQLSEDSRQDALAWAQKNPLLEREWSESESKMAKALKGLLIHLDDDGKIRDFSMKGRKEPEIYLVYFSAAWCGPCREFTPKLISSYKHFKHLGYDNFELIFASWDHGKKSQYKYMKEEQMPWPALKFGTHERFSTIKALQGKGIPCLVMVDREGRIMHHSYQGENYVGPSQVLKAARLILEWSNPDSFTSAQKQFSHQLKTYLLDENAKDREPKAFFLKIDKDSLPENAPESLNIELDLAESGYVDGIHFTDPCSDELKKALKKSSAYWLFFPKIEAGKAVEATFSFQLKLIEAPAEDTQS